MSTQIALFDRAPESSPTVPLGEPQGARALETGGFPFERLSDIAEIESWRKEIYRPLYHIHKWWAQRLGSVFRAVLIGAFAPEDAQVDELFYQPVRLPGLVVFDPFMGSGTTIGEALKLGARAIGRDINPVAYRLVRTAVGLPSREELFAAFHSLEKGVGQRLRTYYRARLSDGEQADVLYYFWVKQLDCPNCTVPVDLFTSFVFAQHVYPTRYPDAQILCPCCGAINVARFDSAEVSCGSCGHRFDPEAGPARGSDAKCPSCEHVFPIARTARAIGTPPRHRLYAKLVLTNAGRKLYLPADDFDRDLYAKAERELKKRGADYPDVAIAPGHNTNQALGYGYTRWHQMFNARQLLGFGLLAEQIRAIGDERVRDVFLCLFSSALEFNNLFTSFKGEGTGAVRHMFSHHVLKPERTPLEANLWGTPKSSGSFSTLFERRILKALDYCERPFEVRRLSTLDKTQAGEKAYDLSEPIFHEPARSFLEFRKGASLYLSCGDSSHTDIASESVDAVVTDPPFFDNVHYSELADFFHVWQRHVAGESTSETTRSESEVQARDVNVFAHRLAGVWRECHRVLKPEGLLVFSYHHSRSEGWRAVLRSLIEGGFALVRVHPIKAEMSGATPKRQAKEPIDMDILMVCRKRSNVSLVGEDQLLAEVVREAEAQLQRLLHSGRTASRGDVRIVVMAQIIARLSRLDVLDVALSEFDRREREAVEMVEVLYRRLTESRTEASAPPRQTEQLGLSAGAK